VLSLIHLAVLFSMSWSDCAFKCCWWGHESTRTRVVYYGHSVPTPDSGSRGVGSCISLFVTLSVCPCLSTFYSENGLSYQHQSRQRCSVNSRCTRHTLTPRSEGRNSRSHGYQTVCKVHHSRQARRARRYDCSGFLLDRQLSDQTRWDEMRSAGATLLVPTI